MSVEVSPARVIRTYLDEHEGTAEVPFHNLLTTWHLDDAADGFKRGQIEGALAGAGVEMRPSPAQLAPDDLVTLYVRPVETPPTPEWAPTSVSEPAPAEPPQGPPPGSPRRSRWRSPWAAAGAAIAVGLIVGGGVVAYVKLSDDSKERAAAALNAGEADVSNVAGLLARADEFADVKAAGAEARRDSARLASRIRDVESIEDSSISGPAKEALGAEATALQAVARLADAREPKTEDWGSVEKALRQASLTLEQASPDIDELDLKGVKALPAPALISAARNASALIERGERRLNRWRRRVAQVRREKRGAVAVMNSYASSMRSYLARWNELRASLDSWIQGVDSHGATFDEAYSFLSTASADRSSLRQGMSALDAPPAVAGAHNRLLTALGAAIAAVDSASSGIAEYQLDFDGEYLDYKDTPGWQQFRSESDRIGGESAAATSALESLIASEKRKVERRALPRRPKV